MDSKGNQEDNNLRLWPWDMNGFLHGTLPKKKERDNHVETTDTPYPVVQPSSSRAVGAAQLAGLDLGLCVCVF